MSDDLLFVVPLSLGYDKMYLSALISLDFKLPMNICVPISCKGYGTLLYIDTWYLEKLSLTVLHYVKVFTQIVILAVKIVQL